MAHKFKSSPLDQFRVYGYDAENPKIIGEITKGRQIDVHHIYFFGSKSPNATEVEREAYKRHEELFFSALFLGRLADSMDKERDFEGSYYSATIKKEKIGFEYGRSLDLENALYTEAGRILRYLLEESKTNLNATTGELVRAVKYCDAGGEEEAAKGWLKLAADRTNGILDNEERILAKAGMRN